MAAVILSCIAFFLLLVLLSNNLFIVKLKLDGINGWVSVSASLLDGWVRLRIRLEFYAREGSAHKISLLLNDKPLAIAQNSQSSPFQKLFFRKLLKRMRMELLKYNAVIGIKDDAFATARLCGIAIAAFNTLSAVLLSKGVTNITRSQVRPDFERDIFVLISSCMIKIKTGHSILAAVFAVFEILKGAVKRWHTQLKASWEPLWKT